MKRALLVALLVVLAGCQIPGLGGSDGTPTPTETETQTPAPTPVEQVREDPETDVIGWENGTWHNDSIDVTAEDGLNQSELNRVVARSMARVEYVRGLEFNETVPVEVINRSTYRNRTESNHSEALTEFDNAKFEALFLVGETNDSIEVQEGTREATVLGYYSSSEDSIVIVSESATPRLSSERTLSHELVHALQDQHFDLGNLSYSQTRDGYQGRNGIVEGDARYTERLYMSKCGVDWYCVNASTSGGGGGSDIHLGIHFLQYFPYSDGPGLVDSLRSEGGWAAVNDAYADLPDGAVEVTYVEEYPGWEPENVSVGSPSGEWTQIEPPNRPNYGRMGQSAVVASMVHTYRDDYNENESLVTVTEFINYTPNGTIDIDRPYNYDIPAAAGWAGGHFEAYERGDELAYVWRTEWEGADEAQAFAAIWRDLLAHYGGEQVEGDVWRIPEGPYEDSFRITVDGSTVTVVNAPERADLAAFDDV